MNARSSPFAPFPKWEWKVPARLNIGVACTDAHLGTPAADRAAMIVEDDALGTSSITYRALAERTSRFAQLLRDLGIPRGDRVLIRLPNSLDYPTAFLGAMKRGAVSVPTSTLLTAEEVEYLAHDSGAHAIVIDKAAWKAMGPKLAGKESLRYALLSGPGEVAEVPGIRSIDLGPALEAISTWEPAEDTAFDDPAYLVYTSGTTGYPKGVLHGHRSLFGRTPAATYWFHFLEHGDHEAGAAPGRGDRIVHSGKFNWTYVLGSALMDPLYHGKTVIAHEGKNDAETWPKLIAKHGATIFIGVPTIYRQILQKTTFSKSDVPTLRHCMSAGEHLSDEVFGLWKERFGLDIFEAVGMSEFSYYLSQSRFRPIRPGSAGFPQPGHDIRLLNPETLEEVAPGEEGMICIPESDPGLFLSYWNLPEETAKLRHDGWFFTGDYARYDADGYIWFLGRKDDIIKSFGYRVSPYEIERVLKSHPAVADCACVGEEAGKDKLLVVAYVIAHAGAAVTADELAAFGREHLAAYKAPKVVYLARDFPRTRNGKILRREIRPDIALARSTA
ncbi:MAG: acyl-CoA synthetase [Betaproteobacteria bacterium]|nr:acyl-CoA synthetase [Betaproteobacteria bacterium]